MRAVDRFDDTEKKNFAHQLKTQPLFCSERFMQKA